MKEIKIILALFLCAPLSAQRREIPQRPSQKVLVAEMQVEGPITGRSFTSRRAFFNNKKVTVSDAVVFSPLSEEMSRTPGPLGSERCSVPKGFESVQVTFKSDPEFAGCFYMERGLAKRVAQMNMGKPRDAQITFQGDDRMGYLITIFRTPRSL